MRVAFVLVLAVALGSACSNPKAPSTSPIPAPDTASEAAPANSMVSGIATPTSHIELTTPDELKAAIAALKGQVVVVNFWATWCPPCIAEMPHFVSLYREYADKGAALVSVSVDHPETIEKNVKPFVTEKQLPFDVNVISTENPDDVGNVLSITEWSGAVPVTLVYDRAGRRVKEWYGEVTIDMLKKEIEPLITAAE